jgi:tRNA threonylcarbamoyladenosine biosynthesis protein TsaE
MAIGERLGAGAGPGTVILLVGPLGSGKTVMARGIGRGLGVEEEITSPTYTIVSEYTGRRPFHHVDLYRVEGAAQLENLGLDDILWGDGVSVIEWGEKLEGLPGWPSERCIRVTLAIGDAGTRDIVIRGTGA